MTTPPMTHVGRGTMGATASAMPAATSAVKRSKPTAPAVIATAATPTAMPTAATPTAMPPAAATTPAAVSATPATPMPAGDCRDVRDQAKRAHRNACRQNAYRSLHGALSLIEVGSNAREPTHLNVTVVSAASFLVAKLKFRVNFR
jgi:hypothetical protein